MVSVVLAGLSGGDDKKKNMRTSQGITNVKLSRKKWVTARKAEWAINQNVRPNRKPCPICHVIKEDTKYSNINSTLDGLSWCCKACRNIKAKQLYDFEKRRDVALKSRYGISSKDRQIIYELQEGRCYMCHRTEIELKKSLHVDHIHGLKGPEAIRGLLCDMCNGRILPFLAKFPHLKNDLVKQYLERRPLLNQNESHSLLR